MVRHLPIALALVLASPAIGPAFADEARQPTLDVSVQRHVTSNALDGPIALPDRYWLLRGGLNHTVEHDLGSTAIRGLAEARRYDIYDIENDLSLGLQAETTIRPHERLELRGTLGFKHVDEGDDLPILDSIIGTRTGKSIASAGLQAGLRLDAATVVAVEGQVANERASQTRFENEILPALALEPDYRRYRVAARLTHTAGRLTFGPLIAFDRNLARPTDLNPLAFSSDIYTLRGQLELALSERARLGASLGIQSLRGADGAITRTSPTYELAAQLPLLADTTLRGSLLGAFEASDTDDPIASWMRRAELGLSVPLHDQVKASLGGYHIFKHNLLLEDDETTHGLFGMVTYQATQQTSLYLRVDYKRRWFGAFGLEERTVDAHLGVRAQL